MMQCSKSQNHESSMRPLKFHVSTSVELALLRGATVDPGQSGERCRAGPDKVQCKSCGNYEYVFRRKCYCGADIFQQAESELIASYEDSWRSHETLTSRVEEWSRSLRTVFGLTTTFGFNNSPMAEAWNERR